MGRINEDLTRETLAQLLGVTPVERVEVSQWIELRSPVESASLWHFLLQGDALDEPLPCLMYVPKTEGPHPIALALHQHNDEYALGKSEPAGIAGNPDAAYGLRLAAHGYRVICPDFKGFEERRNPDDVHDEFLMAMEHVVRGGSLHGSYVRDVTAALSYVETLEGSADNVTVVGHSLGGQMALLCGALDDRISNVAISCGLTTLSACFGERIAHNPGWYVPRLALFGDYPAVARLLTNKRVFALCATADVHFPAQGAQDVIDALPGADAHVVWKEGGHDMTAESLQLMVDWIFEQPHVDTQGSSQNTAATDARATPRNRAVP